MRLLAAAAQIYFILCFTTAPNIAFWLVGFTERDARALWFLSWALSALVGYVLWRHLRDEHPTA